MKVEDGGNGYTREGRCRQCKCSLVENPNLKRSKCHKQMKTKGCEKQMKTRGKRLDSIVFTNADPRFAGKPDDPQGGDMTTLMQQVREVMTVNQEMENESSWIWLTSEQMGFPLRSEFANENHGEAGSSKQCNDQRTDQTAFFLALIITEFIRNTKRELYDEKLEDALEMLDLELSKHDDTKTQCNRLNNSPLHRGNAFNENGPAQAKRRMQWEVPSKPLAVDDPLLLPE